MPQPLRNFVPNREISLPDDFDSQEEFIEHIRNLFMIDLRADHDNRVQAHEDMEFFTGKQWDDDNRRRREARNKPVITINRLPAFVAQLVGNRMANEQSIKILADNGGTKEIATVRESLIRSIQKNSKADRIYNKAYKDMVVSGMGCWQVSLDFADNDVFEQDIKIVRIDDPLSVIWDQDSIDETGADANHVFVLDRLSRDEFDRRYPDANPGFFDVGDGTVDPSIRSEWYGKDFVQVASFWMMVKETRTLAQVESTDEDGNIEQKVIDITDVEDTATITNISIDINGAPMIRESEVTSAEMYLVTGSDILEGPYKLPISRLPVFRSVGWQMTVSGEQKRWGLVRFLKDPQRLSNYWRSVTAQRLIATPNAKFIGGKNALKGYQKDWENASNDDTNVLLYDDEAGQMPQIVPPAQLEPALLQESAIAAEDIRNVSNIHEAQLGIASNEVSGRAIDARRRGGEISNIIYDVNMNEALEETGKVINELIPIVYDSPRAIRIIGADETDQTIAAINDETNAESIDITSGKYSVSMTTAPTQVTKRFEANENMMNIINSLPDVTGQVLDLIVEAQDWPGADKIAARIRQNMEINTKSPDELTDQEIQQQQQQAQASQQAQELQLRRETAEIQLLEAQALEENAKAQKAIADAQKAQVEAQVSLIEAGLNAERNTAEVRKIEIDTLAGLETQKPDQQEA